MFYISKPFQCSYYKEKTAQYVLFYPPKNCSELKKNKILTQLSENGFRRNNDMFYRPHCEQCKECISLRIDIENFELKKRFKRIIRKNSAITYQLCDAKVNHEHFSLYQKYQAKRHDNGSMNYHSISEYYNHLIKTTLNMKLIEFRDSSKNDQLVAVAIVDILNDGLSAVYTFFDVEYEKFSLGSYAILKQIELCQHSNKSWLYLGYWLKDHRKMQYKSDFSPYQLFLNNRWVNP